MIFGGVSDVQGAAIPGASITLTNANTGQARRILANDSGQYLFPSLPIGTYSLAVEQPAFKRYERTGILIQANENVKVDIALEVGDIKTTVSVDAAASQVEVRSSTIKETVDRARVIELPLNGRNAADLALLATGVSAFSSNTGDASSRLAAPWHQGILGQRIAQQQPSLLARRWLEHGHGLKILFCELLQPRAPPFQRQFDK